MICTTTDERTNVASSYADVKSLLSNKAWRWPDHQGGMLDPRFFLATVDEKTWIPRIVVVSTWERITGLAYFKERRISRFGTGILYGDATLSPLVLADRPDRKRVFRMSVEALLKRPRVWGLRILVPPGGYEIDALRETSASVPADLNYDFAENHVTLPLPRDYGCFLENLGPTTRRNFKYYRRRFEQAGHRYLPRVNPDDFARAAAEFLTKSVTGADRDGVRRALKILAVVKRPLLAGLQDRNGQWLSILGGWRESQDGIVFFQMNDDLAHASSSLCLVMRGYLIEDLIADGVEGLHFWAGVGDPLRRSCVPVPAFRVFLDRRGVVWSGFRASVLAAVRVFPRRMRWTADWIACNRINGGRPDGI